MNGQKSHYHGILLIYISHMVVKQTRINAIPGTNMTETYLASSTATSSILFTSGNESR